ncbi:MAG: hypothetical protein ACK52I_10000 [Pseudomonadota bacterium]
MSGLPDRADGQPWPEDIQGLDPFVAELKALIAGDGQRADPEAGHELFKRWKARLADHLEQAVSAREARVLRQMSVDPGFPSLHSYADVYRRYGRWLMALVYDMQQAPERYGPAVARRERREFEKAAKLQRHGSSAPLTMGEGWRRFPASWVPPIVGVVGVAAASVFAVGVRVGADPQLRRVVSVLVPDKFAAQGTPATQ